MNEHADEVLTAELFVPLGEKGEKGDGAGSGVRKAAPKAYSLKRNCQRAI